MSLAIENPAVLQSGRPTVFPAPKVVDLNVNGACNLNCSWCWGPEHSDAIETVTTDEWKTLIRDLGAAGTTAVVFTGGETLMKKDLPELARTAKEVGMRTTLSTNGILLPKRHAEILPYIDDLGLPLDGPTKQVSEAMRKPLGRTSPHFQNVIRSLQIAQKLYPDIDLTVRTVVGQPNVEVVHQIGGVLLNAGIQPDQLRWKLYQCNPTGPRRDDILSGGWLISDQAFDEALARTVKANPDFNHVTGQRVEESADRYFFVYPDGESSVNMPATTMSAEGVPLNTEVSTGNVVQDFSGTMYNLWLNNLHADRLSK